MPSVSVSHHPHAGSPSPPYPAPLAPGSPQTGSSPNRAYCPLWPLSSLRARCLPSTMHRPVLPPSLPPSFTEQCSQNPHYSLPTIHHAPSSAFTITAPNLHCAMCPPSTASTITAPILHCAMCTYSHYSLPTTHPPVHSPSMIPSFTVQCAHHPLPTIQCIHHHCPHPSLCNVCSPFSITHCPPLAKPIAVCSVSSPVMHHSVGLPSLTPPCPIVFSIHSPTSPVSAMIRPFTPVPQPPLFTPTFLLPPALRPGEPASQAVCRHKGRYTRGIRLPEPHERLPGAGDGTWGLVSSSRLCSETLGGRVTPRARGWGKLLAGTSGGGTGRQAARRLPRSSPAPGYPAAPSRREGSRRRRLAQGARKDPWRSQHPPSAPEGAQRSGLGEARRAPPGRAGGRSARVPFRRVSRSSWRHPHIRFHLRESCVQMTDM
ncbi:vegetative cell wall protein gp1-like [Trachemys scripta elegans]|uniref:vegetative cell wall protein gp1-like n=1 Tax=Trachemys scripta elegans TaxID=31138 RepID=UPI00155703F5|nr:vegetative cell wall protein gp1-like [Trachemys scripta elegans]